jgi:hypothetical protein
MHFDQTRQVLSQVHGTTLRQEGALVAIAANIDIALSKYAAAVITGTVSGMFICPTMCRDAA